MIVEDQNMSDCFATYGDRPRQDREDFLRSSRCCIRQPVGSNIHYSLSSFRTPTFQKTSKIFKPRITRMTGMNADHSQFWCLLNGPAESKPNRRITKAKTIGVTLMASSLIDKKSPRPGCRAEHRATDLRRQTRRKDSSLSLGGFGLSSRYFS